MNRRHFLVTACAAALPAQEQTNPWGNPVLDIHLHPRRSDALELNHLAGSGVAKAVLLPGGGSEERAKKLVAEHPDRFARFTNADVREADAPAKLRAALKSGAIGMGELKYPVQLDGPEMRRVYDIAAETGFPVLIHFQENDFNSGIRRFPALLKAYPKTIFLAHANSWWAHISGEVDDKIAYQPGPVKPGGLTGKILADYPNVYGDLSANSGRNAMQRDPEFAARFIETHKNKLIFGSDCGCRDGRGLNQPQPTPQGKCVARETLATLKKYASPQLFKQITWDNGMKLLKIPT